MGSLNWSEALKVAGQGVRDLAGTELDRENREIEYMREQAIRELEHRQDLELEKGRQTHAKELQSENQKFETDLFDKRTKFETDRDERQNKADDERLRRQLGHQSAMEDKRTIAAAIEDANRNYNAQQIALQNHRKELDSEKAKLVAELGESADMSAFDELYDQLDEQAKQARQQYVMTTRRIMAGGYGKTEVLSEEDVRRLVGEKGSNLEQPALDEPPPPDTVNPDKPGQRNADSAPVVNKPATPEEPPGPANAYGAMATGIGDLFESGYGALSRGMMRGNRGPSPEEEESPFDLFAARPVPRPGGMAR